MKVSAVKLSLTRREARAAFFELTRIAIKPGANASPTCLRLLRELRGAFDDFDTDVAQPTLDDEAPFLPS